MSSAQETGALHSYAVLAGVASNMRSGLILLDREGRVIYSNPSAERLLGISLSDMLEQSHFDMRQQLLPLTAHPASAQTELDRLWLHPEEEQTTELALTDAAVRWLRIHSFPVYHSSSHAPGRGVLLDDITLERASLQARSETLALAAHELKTPLAIIKGCATTLLGNSPRWEPAMLRELLQMIDTQTDRLHDVLNTLLDIWRLDAGVQHLRLTEVRLAEMLIHLVERWRINAPRHTFILHLPDLAEQVHTISCDALRIEQVINHMLNNAVIYSQIGSPVTLRLEYNDTEMRLSISDAGKGIAPADLERIFHRFYRVQQREEHSSGSGLGLAAARATIEAHGGSIWAESAGIGHGATFYFTLPRLPDRQASSASQAAAPSTPMFIDAAPPAPLPLPRRSTALAQSRERVVVVENDPRMARYLRAHLEEQHYQVQVVTHGLQFLRQLDLEEPDLILLASNSGDITGEEMVQRLREFSRIPILMLCESGDEDEHVRYLDLGADDFVVKPFSIKEVLARVRVLLRRYANREQSVSVEPLFASGNLRIDFVQRQVSIDECTVPLSRTEYKLLSVLAQNAGRVMTHELLLERVWGAEYNREVDFIWVYISRLRRKIENDPRHPRFIITVPDVGYKLVKLP